MENKDPENEDPKNEDLRNKDPLQKQYVSFFCRKRQNNFVGYNFVGNKITSI